MTNWIEIRDQLPPVQMRVLFYVKDEINGYTEDYMIEGCISIIKEEGTYNQKIEYNLRGIDKLEEFEKVSFWTLLPARPVVWK